MHVIGVFNRDGGTFKTTDMDAFARRAVAIFAAHGHDLDARVVSGDALVGELQDAASKADLLLAGGGDGTISAAAAAAYRGGIRLAALPAGTMNLFARSLGIPPHLEEALEALADGEARDVDIATANGRPFIHQFSVGIHPKLVKLRETLNYHGRVGKMLASTRAAASVVFRPPNFHIEVLTPHGLERRRAAGISVSNNPFEEGHIPHTQRPDTGLLGIYIVKPLTAWVLLKLSLAVLRGKWKSAPDVIDKEAREVTIRFPRRKATAMAVVDGELIALAQRVDLKIHAGALKVVVPRAKTDARPGSELTAA